MAQVLRKDFIMKECVRQGFYRTPSCNDKLYLHHKGFTDIEPNALAEYTDVKVLWLEGNCFSELPHVEKDDDDASEKAIEVIPLTENSDAEPVVEKAQGKGSSSRFVFGSMHPTLRQFYLHSNLLQTMPDLSLFQRLDAFNLSDNFINTVESGCPCWSAASIAAETEAAAAAAEKKADAEAAIAAEKKQESKKQTSELESESALSPSKSSVAPTCDRGVSKQSALDAMRENVRVWARRCTHNPGDPTPCGTVTTIHMKNNHLKEPSDIAQLLCYKSLSVLDLSNNRFEDGEAILCILEKMENLKSLYLSGNPCVRSISNYRRTVISRCKKLMHLDDRPVFDDERRLVTAWATGGADAEAKEKKLMRFEEEERHRKRLEDFRAMMNAGRNAVRRNEGAEEEDSTTTESEPDSNPTPSSSDNETSTPADPPVTQQRVRPRRETTNKPHSGFYELNYGREAAVEGPERRPGQMPSSSATAITGSIASEDRPGEVRWGNHVIRSTTGQAAASATRLTSLKSSALHADPFAGCASSSASQPEDESDEKSRHDQNAAQPPDVDKEEAPKECGAAVGDSRSSSADDVDEPVEESAPRLDALRSALGGDDGDDGEDDCGRTAGQNVQAARGIDNKLGSHPREDSDDDDDVYVPETK